MLTRNATRGDTARAAGLAAALVAAMTAALPAGAELPAPGMMTVREGDLTVLHAVSTHEPSPEHPGCRITASFVDARGETLQDRTGNPIQASFVLRDNVAASLRLPVAQVLQGQPQRLVRAKVSEDTGAGDSNCCALTLTVERSNATRGTSELILPRAPNPPSPVCVDLTR